MATARDRVMLAGARVKEETLLRLIGVPEYGTVPAGSEVARQLGRCHTGTKDSFEVFKEDRAALGVAIGSESSGSPALWPGVIIDYALDVAVADLSRTGDLALSEAKDKGDGALGWAWVCLAAVAFARDPELSTREKGLALKTKALLAMDCVRQQPVIIGVELPPLCPSLIPAGAGYLVTGW
jgi:hypothetical protein